MPDCTTTAALAIIWIVASLLPFRTMSNETKVAKKSYALRNMHSLIPLVCGLVKYVEAHIPSPPPRTIAVCNITELSAS